MSEPIKIRTIPRSNEKPAEEAQAVVQAPSNRPKALAIVMVASAVALGLFGFWQGRKAGAERAPQMVNSNQATDPVTASVHKHMYDTHLMEEMNRRKILIENQKTLSKRSADEYAMLPDTDRNFGVQLDQENTLERIYQDLNLDKTKYGAENIEDRINSRLANRKWLNEMERAERINFVRNFIRQAYDRGWEVQIDANLVVTGVRRIVEPKQVNIDQVLDRIAKQGH